MLGENVVSAIVSGLNDIKNIFKQFALSIGWDLNSATEPATSERPFYEFLVWLKGATEN